MLMDFVQIALGLSQVAGLKVEVAQVLLDGGIV